MKFNCHKKEYLLEQKSFTWNMPLMEADVISYVSSCFLAVVWRNSSCYGDSYFLNADMHIAMSLWVEMLFSIG